MRFVSVGALHYIVMPKLQWHALWLFKGLHGTISLSMVEKCGWCAFRPKFIPNESVLLENLLYFPLLWTKLHCAGTRRFDRDSEVVTARRRLFGCRSSLENRDDGAMMSLSEDRRIFEAWISAEIIWYELTFEGRNGSNLGFNSIFLETQIEASERRKTDSIDLSECVRVTHGIESRISGWPVSMHL